MYERTCTNILFYPFRLAVAVGAFYIYLIIFVNFFLQCIIVHNHDRPALCELDQRMKEKLPCFYATVRPNATNEASFSSLLVLPLTEGNETEPKVGDKVPCYFAVYRGNVFIPKETKSVRPEKGSDGRNIGAIIITGLLGLIFFVFFFVPICLPLAVPPLSPTKPLQRRTAGAGAKNTSNATDTKSSSVSSKNGDNQGGKKAKTSTTNAKKTSVDRSSMSPGSSFFTSSTSASTTSSLTNV